MTSRVEMAENAKVKTGAGSQPAVHRGDGVGQTGPTLDARVHKRIAGQSHAHEPKDFFLDIAFRADPGFTILFGASGAGKTTLLDCIAGLVTPDAGRITIAARVLFNRGEQVDLSPAERRIGYVFQDLALFPHMTVEQNVEYGLAHLSHGERRELSAAILKALRIDPLAQRKPRQISGG